MDYKIGADLGVTSAQVPGTFYLKEVNKYTVILKAMDLSSGINRVKVSLPDINQYVDVPVSCKIPVINSVEVINCQVYDRGVITISLLATANVAFPTMSVDIVVMRRFKD